MISWYERVHQEVEAFFRSIPEKRDFLVGLAEDSGPSSGIGHRQHWKRRSVTPSWMGLAQLKPLEAATRGGIGTNNAMYEAPNLSPNPVISSINLGVSFGSAYDGQTRDYHGDSD